MPSWSSTSLIRPWVVGEPGRVLEVLATSVVGRVYIAPPGTRVVSAEIMAVRDGIPDGDSLRCLTYFSCPVCHHTYPGRSGLSIDSHSWCTGRQPWDLSSAGRRSLGEPTLPGGRTTLVCALCEEA